jgi:glycine cleavage system transcriptional repressor
MAKKWYMLTVIGKDRTGIVAHVTAALYDGGCNLGEATMARLGGNFTIMLMVQFEGSRQALMSMIEPVVESLDLHVHVDSIRAELHRHLIPDVRVSVYGADRAGIVAQVTTALTEAGLNILDLESDVAGSEKQPIYIMTIEGQAIEGTASLQAALDILADQGIETSLAAIDTMIG